jgi:hypothetical protein
MRKRNQNQEIFRFSDFPMNITRLRTAGRLVTAALLAVASKQAFAAQPQTFTDNFTQNYSITCPYGDLNASTTVSDQGFVFLEPTDKRRGSK